MSGVWLHVTGVRCHISGVSCQVSHVRCHMSGVTGLIFSIIMIKNENKIYVIELVGGGSGIKKAYPF